MTRGVNRSPSMRPPGSIVRCSRISIRSAMSRCVVIAGWRFSSRRVEESASRSCDSTTRSAAPRGLPMWMKRGGFESWRRQAVRKGHSISWPRAGLSGPISLEITLCDEDRAIGRLTLLDWSAQASTQLSPTAGWGVPENAIEFSLNGDEPTSPASLFITLAATSVGRGWDSVGHAAGTYRNRITIEPGPPCRPRRVSFRGA